MLTDFFQWVSLTGSLMLSVAYGLNVESEEDEYYSASVEAMDAVRVAIASNFLVDVFPIRAFFWPRFLPNNLITLVSPQSNVFRNGSPGRGSSGSREWRRRVSISP